MRFKDSKFKIQRFNTESLRSRYYSPESSFLLSGPKGFKDSRFEDLILIDVVTDYAERWVVSMYFKDLICWYCGLAAGRSRKR
jgi:hypothetical protein